MTLPELAQLREQNFRARFLLEVSMTSPHVGQGIMIFDARRGLLASNAAHRRSQKRRRPKRCARLNSRTSFVTFALQLAQSISTKATRFSSFWKWGESNSRPNQRPRCVVHKLVRLGMEPGKHRHRPGAVHADLSSYPTCLTGTQLSSIPDTPLGEQPPGIRDGAKRPSVVAVRQL